MASQRGWQRSAFHRLAHSDSPGGGVSGSFRLPGSLGRSDSAAPHPDAPASRCESWRTHGLALQTAGDDHDLTRCIADIDKTVDAATADLQRTLPDAFLQTRYRAHADRVNARHRGDRLHRGVNRLTVLRHVYELVGWVDIGRFAGLREQDTRWALASGHSAVRADERAAQAGLLEAVVPMIERAFGEARNSVEARWTEASVGGTRQQEALLREWNRHLDYGGRPTGVGEEQHHDAERPRRMPPPPPRIVKTWIEFELIDDDGNPVPHAAYAVILPDGERRSGQLDAKGRVRFADIDPGQCQVGFPEIDGREWRPA